MSSFKPDYITFDCYGTLIHFRMAELARQTFARGVAADALPAVIGDFSAYRMDEVLGDWKPYRDVVGNAVRRTCAKWRIDFHAADAERIYQAVPAWGPHPDTVAGLQRLATKFRLVILSNAANEQIQANVEKLEAPFHAVFTAEQAQSYKPRMRGFEYMMEKLGCGPQNLLHVSSSLRYDLMTAHDLGIKNKIYVNRGHEPSTPYYGYTEVADIGGLAAFLGV
jgi:2-haloacid dehalogenase